MKKVVVVATHKYNSVVERKFRRIQKELNKNDYDFFLLYHTEGKDSERFISEDIPVSKFRMADLNALSYHPIADTLIPGSTHFPLLYFFNINKDYEYFWYIEYDVEFKGLWKTLINDCDNNLLTYDFLSCHIEKFSRSNSSWPWWFTGNDMRVPFAKCIKSFNPICRYSNQALTCLDDYLRQGYYAHSEVLIATCLYYHGMKIGDIGGQGEFVPEGWENRYYLAAEGINNGTMRYRPVYTREEIAITGRMNMLFHPLKE